MKCVIGLVGENGAGKSSIAKQIRLSLDRIGTSTILRFSQILVETLDLWGIEATRVNLQLLARQMEVFGKGSLSRAVEKRVATSDEDVIILDGIRWWSDFDLVRGFPCNFVVYVTASQEIRYQRLISRAEKAGERVMTYDQFLAEDAAPNEALIGEIGSVADYTITNNHSFEEFKDQI